MLDPTAPERVLMPSPAPARGLEHSALPLWRSSSRVVWLAAGAVAALLAISAGLGAAGDSSINSASRVVLVAVGAVALLRVLFGTIQAFRAALGDTPWLEVHPDLGLRLHDRIVLREPLVIPRDALRAGAVEGAPRRRRGLGASLVRFRVADAEAWTWSARSGSRLPQLGHARDIPNVALVLNSPIAAPRVRRGSRTWMLGHPPHGRVRGGEPLGGLLCTVRDPELLERALATWGLADTLQRADLDLAPPTPPARRRQRHYTQYALAAFVVWTALQALAGFGVFN